MESNKKEGEKVGVTYFQRSSAGLQGWICGFDAAVSSCSSTVDANDWMLEVTDDGASFDALSRCELRFETLDSKLRTALTRFTVGDQANKHRELPTSSSRQRRIANAAEF